MRHVVERHALEAAVLWRLREEQAQAPAGTLAIVERFDRRVEAHLDGLRIAGEEGWRLARAEIVPKRSESLFPVAWLAFGSGDEERVEALLSPAGGELGVALDGEVAGDWGVAVGSTSASAPSGAEALEAALDWHPFDRLWNLAERWFGSEDPRRRLLGLAACARHRSDPLWAVDRALGDPAAPLRLRAVVAAGELGRTDLVPRLRALWIEEDAALRFAAARSCALLGERGAGAILRQIALAGGPNAGQAAHLAARALPPAEAQGLIRALDAEPASARRAVLAAGASGLAELIPWLIERAADAELARAAGAAVSLITGLDLEAEGLSVPPPAGLQAGPTDDPADPAVAMDTDRGLPFPAATLGDWWLRERHRFAEGRRTLRGVPVAEAPLEAWIADGTTPVRRAAALERKLRAPVEPLFPWLAPAPRQRAWLREPPSELGGISAPPGAGSTLARAS